MKFIFRFILLQLAFTLVLPSVSVKAQKWEAIGSLGLSGYMGEYNPENILKFNSRSGGLGAKYNFNPTWGIRGSIAVFGVNGKGNYTVNPGLPVISTDETFKSKTLLEVSILPEFNFFKFEPTQSKYTFTPYVFAGVGGIVFQQKNGTNLSKKAMKPVIPFGAGFKFNLKGSLSIDSHLSYRIAGTDMLDDIGEGWSGDFLNKLNSADSYMTFQVGLTYTFFKQGCPVW